MRTCIVVDDSPFDRKMCAVVAARAGLTVTEAGSGKEAMDLCRKSLPKYILLDWEMQGMDGIEFMKKLHEVDNRRKVSVIICTSHQDKKFIKYALESGAAGFITKPITQHKLEEKLDELDLLQSAM